MPGQKHLPIYPRKVERVTDEEHLPHRAEQHRKVACGEKNIGLLLFQNSSQSSLLPPDSFNSAFVADNRWDHPNISRKNGQARGGFRRQKHDKLKISAKNCKTSQQA